MTKKITFSEEEVNDIISEYMNGKSKRKIAIEKQVSQGIIDRTLRENDIEIRGVSVTNSKEIPLENESVVIDNYLNKNMGLQTAGKEFGYSQKVVETILKRNNIKKRTYVEAKQIQRKYSCNDEFFKTPSHDMAYVLGFLAADGSISKKENGIFINLNQKDAEILEKIKIATKSTRPINYYIKKSTEQNLCKFSVWSHEWKHDLAKYGVTPNKTFTLQPPTLLPSEFHIDYIRGYFDADGSVCIRHNRVIEDKPMVKIDGASKAMMDWISETLSKEYSIYTSAYYTKQLTDSNTIMYSYNIYRFDMVQKFYNEIYKNNPFLYLQRKRDKFTSLLSTPRDSNSLREE
jgi:hypothetical protein